MTRPRIVQIIDDLGLGGAQRQLVELVKALPGDRYDVAVISLSTEKCAYESAIRQAGVELVMIPQSGKWSWSAFTALRQALAQRRPDIVQTWLFTADLYGRLAARLTGVPVIMTSVRSIEPWKPWHYVLADRWLAHATDAFTVNADAVGAVLMERERIAPGKIHTIYNGIDLGLFDPAMKDGAVRSLIGVESDAVCVGIVGRFAPEKDHETFIRAAAIALKQEPDAHFVLVGDGVLREHLQELVHVLQLESRIHFVSSQSNIARVFAALDVTVVSSRYEGCCNVILEAMAMARPVIATAVGGNPELVTDGQTGLLVPVQDPAKMAVAMGALIRDRARAQAMGRAGREQIEQRFTLARAVDRTERLYAQLLKQKGACAR